MRRLLAAIIAGMLACATSATVHAAPGGPATKPVTAVIKGVGIPAPNGDIDTTTGACNVSSWVDVCGSGNCSCEQIDPVTIHTTAKGASISNVFITVDNGFNPATEPTVGNGPNPRCNPFVGVLTLTFGNGGQSANFNLIGTSCKHVIGISVKKPQGTHDKDLVSGGWGISATPTPNPVVSGWGTMTGTVIKATNALSLNLAGWITQ